VDGESDPPDAGRPDKLDPAQDLLVLRRHRLSHLSELKVHRSVLETRYAPGCSPGACVATCCQMGVGVDVAQRDQILAHAELVQCAMDPGQDRDPAHWFEETETVDPDFPSGRAVSTRVRESGCVFLDSTRRCALQTATIGAARPGFDLKPFFCTAFPVTIASGTLWIDELCLEMPEHCCRPTTGGTLSVLDVCETELRHVLGDAGLRELRRSGEWRDSNAPC
jgi:Protein of unknown function (DUF3109)